MRAAEGWFGLGVGLSAFDLVADAGVFWMMLGSPSLRPGVEMGAPDAGDGWRSALSAPGLAVSRASSTASSLAERSSRRPSRVAVRARVELDPCRPEFTSSGHPKQSRAGERSAVASSWSVARGSNDLPPARVEEVNELLGAHGEAQRRDLKRGMRGHVPT
jgi:hypothetical protein